MNEPLPSTGGAPSPTALREWPHAGLARLGVRIFLADLGEPETQGDVDHEATPSATVERRRLTARRSAGSWQAARRVLSELAHVPPDALDIRAAPQGKPYLANVCHLRFSLSHAGRHWLMAVSSDREVGADIETLDQLGVDDLPLRQALSERERRAFDAMQTCQERLLAFYRVWTRKEACLKALGSGLHVDPRQVQTPIDAEFDAPFRVTVGARAFACLSIAPFEDLIGAIALAEHG